MNKNGEKENKNEHKTDIIDLVIKDREDDLMMRTNICNLATNRINNEFKNQIQENFKDKIIIDIKNYEESDILFEYKEILDNIKNICQRVYKELGPGYSEYIYHRALEVELRNEEIQYESKRIIPINYKSINIGYGEADIILHINNLKIILELKAISNIPRESEIIQIKTYLRNFVESDFGCIINFPQAGVKVARETIDFKCVRL